MNLIRITATEKSEFSEICEIRKYRNRASDTIFVRKYRVEISKLVVDGEG